MVGTKRFFGWSVAWSAFTIAVFAINQGVFAFAPAIIGALRDVTADYRLPFALIAMAQLLAAAIVLLGRGTRLAPSASTGDQERRIEE